MGRLDKLRSRFFCKKGQPGFDKTAAHSSSRQLPVELESSRKETEPVDMALPHSPTELSPIAIVAPPHPVHSPREPQPSAHQLYWSEARRIHSDPAVNSTSCWPSSQSNGVREERTSNLEATRGTNSSYLEAESDGELDDDEVFLENSPGIKKNVDLHKSICYLHLITKL